MSDIEIRPIREDEFSEVAWVDSMAFGEHPTLEDEVFHKQGFDFERSLGAFADGRLVGTSTSLSLELTLPGGRALPTGGLTWIAVLPTHRRLGIMRQLVSAQLEDTLRRGEAASALLASAGTIYGRFGYGPATSAMSFHVGRAGGALFEPVRQPGRLVLLTAEEAAADLPAIYDDLRLKQPGTVSRPGGWWQSYLHDAAEHQEGAGAMFHVRHETSPGVADGYATYRIKEDWASNVSALLLRVVEVVADGPGVYAALWEYLLNLDLVETVACSRGRVDEPLRWLLADTRQFRVDAFGDYLWLRLLDVPRALAAREYAVAGELVLEIAAPFAISGARSEDPSSGVFLLKAGWPGMIGAECVRVTRAPDLALPTEALGAAYLGGVTFATLAAAGRVRELRAGAVERADAMFRTGTAPYSATEF